MKIPEEFEQVVRGIDPEGPKLESLQSLAAAALRYKDDDDLRPVLAWLNELLDGGHSDAELHYVWSAQSPTGNAHGMCDRAMAEPAVRRQRPRHHRHRPHRRALLPTAPRCGTASPPRRS